MILGKKEKTDKGVRRNCQDMLKIGKQISQRFSIGQIAQYVYCVMTYVVSVYSEQEAIRGICRCSRVCFNGG